MKKTENYQLNQWEAEDTIRREDFNADNAAIDAALKTIADNAGGGLKIAAGSYTGTGTYGSDNPKTLTFAFAPKLLIVQSDPAALEIGSGAIQRATLLTVAGSSQFCFPPSSYVYLTWGANYVKWYTQAGAYLNMNYSGITYRYLAIG